MIVSALLHAFQFSKYIHFDNFFLHFYTYCKNLQRIECYSITGLVVRIILAKQSPRPSRGHGLGTYTGYTSSFCAKCGYLLLSQNTYSTSPLHSAGVISKHGAFVAFSVQYFSYQGAIRPSAKYTIVTSAKARGIFNYSV